MITRRAFLATSAATAIAGAFGRQVFVDARQAPQGPPPTPIFTAIRRNVGYFTMRGGTIGYLIDPRGIVVVDTQFAPEAKVCLQGLNERSGSRPVDWLINTHHHPDHTGGNISFKGAAKSVVAQARAAEHMRQPPGGAPPTGEQLYPDTTFTDSWREQVGDEWVRAKFYGPAHTSGDVVVTFERANVAHMGDLMFNLRHPVIDRAAGASIRNWATVVEKAAADYQNDTIYIFGHANLGLPVVGSRADLMLMRDYLTALLGFVESQIKAGRTRDEILAMRDPLKGFEKHGRFGDPGPRDALTVAYEELTARSD